jgi:hypothetical protein
LAAADKTCDRLCLRAHLQTKDGKAAGLFVWFTSASTVMATETSATRRTFVSGSEHSQRYTMSAYYLHCYPERLQGKKDTNRKQEISIRATRLASLNVGGMDYSSVDLID